MTVTKTKLSVTISASLDQLLTQLAETTGTSKSALVERSLQALVTERLTDDAKKLASLSFNDLPSEDEWLALQNEV